MTIWAKIDGKHTSYEVDKRWAISFAPAENNDLAIYFCEKNTLNDITIPAKDVVCILEAP